MNIFKKYNQSKLITAAKNNDLSGVTKALYAGANANYAFVELVKTDNIIFYSKCNKLTVYPSLDCSNSSPIDKNALRWASEYGNLSMVQCLVQHGANIHAYGDICLLLAAGNGHLPVVKYLVKQGADIHSEGDFALHWATKNGHLSVVKYLKKRLKKLNSSGNNKNKIKDID